MKSPPCPSRKLPWNGLISLLLQTRCELFARVAWSDKWIFTADNAKGVSQLGAPGRRWRLEPRLSAWIRPAAYVVSVKRSNAPTSAMPVSSLSLSIYIYIYIHICICVTTWVNISFSLYIYIYIYNYAYTYIYIYIERERGCINNQVLSCRWSGVCADLSVAEAPGAADSPDRKHEIFWGFPGLHPSPLRFGLDS